MSESLGLTDCSDEYFAESIKQNLGEIFQQKLYKEVRPRSLSVAIIEAVSSLNGNPSLNKETNQHRSTSKWMFSLISDQYTHFSYAGSIDDFFLLFQDIDTIEADKIRRIISADFVRNTHFIENIGVSPDWIDGKYADARFMPGRSKQRLPRLVASIEIMKILKRHQIQRTEDIAVFWSEFAPWDQLTVELRRISGWTIEVGLNQLRRICGDESAIKVDRNILKAIDDLFAGEPRTGFVPIPVSHSGVASRLTRVAKLISVEERQLTPAELDHALWNWIKKKREDKS